MTTGIKHPLDNAKQVEDRSGETVDACNHQLITRHDPADLGLDGPLSRRCQHPDNVWSLHRI